MHHRRLLSLLIFAPVASAQTQLFQIPGDAAGDRAGAAVAVVGDVDADGAVDFAVGSPHADAPGSNSGRVRVYSGRTRQPLHTWTGSSAGQLLGWAVAGVGDLDGDGHDDVALGAPGGAFADVRSGRTGAVLRHLTGAGGSFGYALAGGGEVDGDGVPDVMVGAPDDSTGGASWAGAVYIFSGASGANLRAHKGTVCGGALGNAVAFYGDVDGDGRHEYAYGMPGSIGCSPQPKVFAHDAATGTLLWEDTAAHWSDQLGWSVAALSDITGDGVPEVLAGAPQDPGIGCGGCNGKGYVRLLDGATGSLLWQVDGLYSYSGLGGAVVAVGDLDGDGFEDLAASQPETTGGGGATREVQLRSGLSGALLAEIAVPPPAHSYFGYSLASGEANDDGLRDVLIGTPGDDVAGAYSGSAYAYTVVRGVVAYCQAKVNSQGCTPSVHATGTPSLTAGTFRVRAADVVNNKNGLMFWGRVPTSVPFQGGALCVTGSVTRTALQSSGGNPPPDDCSGAYAFHFSSGYMAGQGIQAGDQLYCQYWYRDPAGVVGTGLTDGLAFLVLP